MKGGYGHKEEAKVTREKSVMQMGCAAVGGRQWVLEENLGTARKERMGVVCGDKGSQERVE